MGPGEIFRYHEPREILIRIFQDKKDRNPSYSIRAWARQLNFKNPSYLSDVINGKRKLKPELALRIAVGLNIPEDERRYFEALVYYSNATGPTERAFYQSIVNKFKPKKEVLLLGKDQRNFSHWVYGTMDELTTLKDFREDYGYLARRLGNDITPQLTELAMRHTMEMGSIRRAADGQLEKIETVLPPAVGDVRRAAIMERKLLWARKEQAFLEQSEEESYFRVSYLPVRRKDVQKFHEELERFMLAMRTQQAEPGAADDVYMMELAFYKLTLGEPEALPKPKRRAKAEGGRA